MFCEGKKAAQKPRAHFLRRENDDGWLFLFLVGSVSSKAGKWSTGIHRIPRHCRA
jgi:hypothetical protein